MAKRKSAGYDIFHYLRERGPGFEFEALEIDYVLGLNFGNTAAQVSQRLHPGGYVEYVGRVWRNPCKPRAVWRVTPEILEEEPKFRPPTKGGKPGRSARRSQLITYGDPVEPSPPEGSEDRALNALSDLVSERNAAIQRCNELERQLLNAQLFPDLSEVEYEHLYRELKRRRDEGKVVQFHEKKGRASNGE